MRKSGTYLLGLTLLTFFLAQMPHVLAAAGTLSSNLVVSLASGDESELLVQSSVTILADRCN